MNFLRNLFGGQAADPDRGVYIYVKPKMCQEILEIRIDTLNELSAMEDEDAYIVRKLTKAVRCPFATEVLAKFDNKRRLISTDVKNGEIVSKEDYLQFVSNKPS